MLGPNFDVNVLLALLHVVCAYVTYQDSADRGHNAVFWGGVGLLFGVVGVGAYFAYDFTDGRGSGD